MITLSPSPPVLFQSDATTAIATHGNGPLVTAAQPAQRGEIVVRYATGLEPDSASRGLDRRSSQFPCGAQWRDRGPGSIQYAGVTPGFAGLFQINLVLPADAPNHPQIQIGYGSQLSPAGVALPLQ
jgi:uncharacterized protein (TIGR03437 family)